MATVQGERVYFIHSDHLGTPRVITDGDNNAVWAWESDPFGVEVANDNPDGDSVNFTYNMRFPGQYHDRETGLSYNANRDYKPSIGRYIESDPLGLPGGTNTYVYVSANPLKYSDPLGLCKCKKDESFAKDHDTWTSWLGVIYNHKVTCRYTCKKDDSDPGEPVEGTHYERYLNTPFDDNGKEGTCLGREFESFFDPVTAQTTWSPTAFSWFDPREDDDRGYRSDELEEWAERNCKCE